MILSSSNVLVLRLSTALGCSSSSATSFDIRSIAAFASVKADRAYGSEAIGLSSRLKKTRAGKTASAFRAELCVITKAVKETNVTKNGPVFHTRFAKARAIPCNFKVASSLSLRKASSLDKKTGCSPRSLMPIQKSAT